MLSTVITLAVIAVVGNKFYKANALGTKAENKAIQANFEALLERKEYADEAKKQDAELYALACKLARK